MRIGARCTFVSLSTLWTKRSNTFYVFTFRMCVILTAWFVKGAVVSLLTIG